MKKKITILIFFFNFMQLFAQVSETKDLIKKAKSLDSAKLEVFGSIGVSYDGYGLNANPGGYSFYNARRPWNNVLFNFQTTFSYGDFKLPIAASFSPMSNNFAYSPLGFGSLPGFPKQTFKQWITNPINNIGINPSYKWAELQLGTQYLKYSDLSTGDIGVFGYGFSLKPNKLRIKFFNGVTQQGFQPFPLVGGSALPPVFLGNYSRDVLMAQIGLEKDEVYFAGFNIVKGTDDSTSIVPLNGPTNYTPKPQENLIISFVSNFKAANGWYGNLEIANTVTNRDITLTGPALVESVDPYLKTNASGYRDHAMKGGFGRKSKNFDLGGSVKWLGAGYNTMGYPFVQNNRLEYAINTRFNLFKNKTNVIANIGQRFGNWNNPSTRTEQIIANINVFSQFSDNFSVNASYNNFGFQTPGLLGIKNVGTDLSINPTYSWVTTTMSNLLSFSYNWSQYDETIPLNITTQNNTNTYLLLYVPTFFSRPNLNPDFSVMYFTNKSLAVNLDIMTFSAGLNWGIIENKFNLKGQLMYNITKVQPFTASNNIVATIGFDYKISPKLSWNTTITANKFTYGDELTPPIALLAATYLESTWRTALLYQFGKKTNAK
jgi:hypothetical protein